MKLDRVDAKIWFNVSFVSVKNEDLFKGFLLNLRQCFCQNQPKTKYIKLPGLPKVLIIHLSFMEKMLRIHFSCKSIKTENCMKGL